MPLRQQRLTMRGFRPGMRDETAPDLDPSHVFLLHNCLVERGEAVLRPGWKRFSSTTIGTRNATFAMGGAIEWTKLDGTTKQIWVQNGQVYYNNAGTPALALTTAQLSGSSISLANASVFMVPFNNQLVFSDGTNTPWMWDGTVGGGLTKLTNAPVAFGQPTVYYAKLFFIKNTDRGTIVWSEENAANTGYEASGYNNAWTLGQTSTSPVLAILGTNEALYYWRQFSMGAIRGAVTPTFTTTGTHDAIGEIGNTIRCGVAAYRGMPIYFNGFFWWADATLKPWRMAPGGAPEPIWEQMARRAALGDFTEMFARPFNLSEDTAVSGLRQIVGNPRTNQVRFYYESSGSADLVHVYDGTTGALLGTEQVVTPRAVAFCTTMFSSGGVPSSQCLMGILVGTTDMYVGTQGALSSLLFGSDQFDSASSTAYTGSIIGSAQGYDEATEWSFEEIDVVFETNDTASSTVAAGYLTDMEHYSTLQAATQSVSATDASYQLKEQRARFGIKGSGAWIRVYLVLTATDRIAVKGWVVKAFATADYAMSVP